MPAILFENSAEAASRLHEIGVSIEVLQRALQAGHLAKITASPNDPPFIPGTMAWSHTVRELRNGLLPLGWKKSDPGNYSLVISEKRAINIVVASGDSNVCTKCTPRTKSIKGLYTEAATIRNRIETDLFPDTLSDELKRIAAILEFPTYILLIHVTDQSYKGELSLPDEMEDGHVVSWKERIFIPNLVSGFDGITIDVSPNDSGPDIDIQVLRLKKNV